MTRRELRCQSRLLLVLAHVAVLHACADDAQSPEPDPTVSPEARTMSGDAAVPAGPDAGAAASDAAGSADAPVSEPLDAADLDGSVGSEDSAAVGEETCVAVSGDGSRQWYTLEIIGRGFDAYAGKRVRVVVTLNPSDLGRFGVADAEVSAGAFVLRLPETLNHGYYTGVGLYVDENGNDRCDPGEPMWDYTTPGVVADISHEIAPEALAPFSEPAAPCVINGFFDLAAYLPCPP